MTGYFPAGQWFDLFSGQAVPNPTPGQGRNVTLSAPLETIPVHIAGGSIIPMQEPALTTTATRQNPFSLLVAFDDSGTPLLHSGEYIC